MAKEKRIGKAGIESKLIGTVANCNLCNPSRNWLDLMLKGSLSDKIANNTLENEGITWGKGLA